MTAAGPAAPRPRRAATRLPAVRAAAAVAGVVLLGVAGWAGRDAWAAHAGFQQSFDAVPLRAEVDVSRAGSTPAAYRQTSLAACAAVLWADRGDLPGGDAGLLDGLTGRLVFRDGAGAVVSEAPFRADAGTAWSDGVRLGSLPTDLPVGTYRATVVVETPAAAAGTITLRGRYLLCGLEALPAYLGGMTAAVAGLIGGGLLLAAVLSGGGGPPRWGAAATGTWIGDGPGAWGRVAGRVGRPAQPSRPMAVDPAHPDRTFRATAPGEPAHIPPRPPGEHGIVDPANVSEGALHSKNASEVSDAEAELLVTDASFAGPTWASSRVIAGAVALVLMGVVVGIGAWLAGWLDDNEGALQPAVIVAPTGAGIAD